MARRWLFLSLMFVVGCNATHQRQAQFVAEEYAPYDKTGTTSIVGQAFLKTRAGDVKYGAGNTVVLNPATSHSAEWFDLHIIGGKALSPPDERARKYQRLTVADGSGGFVFEGLPPGEYLLACLITWEVPLGYGATQKTGGWAYARVKTEEGKQARAILSR